MNKRLRMVSMAAVGIGVALTLVQCDSQDLQSIAVPADSLPGPEAKATMAGDTTSVTAALTTPSGMGRYCSMTWSDGRWGAAWFNDLTTDACQFIRNSLGFGGTVKRAGMFSISGANHAVIRCNASQSFVGLWSGNGAGALQKVFDFAKSNNQSSCILTATAAQMPIFRTPFSGNPTISPRTGFDFARSPEIPSLNLKDEFGQPSASTAAKIVNDRALDRTTPMGQWIDNHNGHDYNLAEGNTIVAVADGTVLAARFRDVTNACATRSSDTQGEVFIRHVVKGGTGGLYDEFFVSYYAHLSETKVTAGQTVTKGTTIGKSGNTGCSNPAHLHFSAMRVTNTANSFVWPTTINTDFSVGKEQRSSNLEDVLTDPYGWNATTGFDPWSWKAYPNGALSTNLWESGQAPPRGDW